MAPPSQLGFRSFGSELQVAIRGDERLPWIAAKPWLRHGRAEQVRR